MVGARSGCDTTIGGSLSFSGGGGGSGVMPLLPDCAPAFAVKAASKSRRSNRLVENRVKEVGAIRIANFTVAGKGINCVAPPF